MFPLPRPGTAGKQLCPFWHLHGYWGYEVSSLCLHSKCFTHQTTHSPFFFINPRSDHKGQQGIVNKRKKMMPAQVTARVCNPSTRVGEAGGSMSLRHLGLCDELQTDPA